jgi:tetratricopeptide (TPR) repeat protein
VFILHLLTIWKIRKRLANSAELGGEKKSMPKAKGDQVFLTNASKNIITETNYKGKNNKPTTGDLLDTATKAIFSGPLHQAIQILENMLQINPGLTRACTLLADVYARQARFEEAIRILKKTIAHRRSNKKKHKSLLKQMQTLIKIKNDLASVNQARFDHKGFLAKVIIPDGAGSYFVDTLGFPGNWDIKTDQEIENGALLRFSKALAHCLNNHFGMQILLNGTIKVRQQEEPLQLEVFHNQHQHEISVLASVSTQFLFASISSQREKIRKYLVQIKTKPATRMPVTRPEAFPEGLPYVCLISPGLTSDYGIDVLSDRLRASRIKTDCLYLRNFQEMDSYLQEYQASVTTPPHIFAVSVIDIVIEDTNRLIKKLRQLFPEAFIIIGGPSTQTPEQLAVLIPDFDILVRGDGDTILPLIACAIGNTRRSSGFNEEQLDYYKKLPGGIVVKAGQRVIINNLQHTNTPDFYHLPPPLQQKNQYYWQTSRGCPYHCHFCNYWSGKQYRYITPQGQTPLQQPTPAASARAMKDWLIARLALETNENITNETLEQKLATAQSRQKIFSFPSLVDKILIAIVDDDFLINRERIQAFYQEVTRLGLQHYFQFTAITSVRTLYRQGTIDRELIGWLKACGFQALNLGTDGLCQGVIEQNGKGYSLDRQVIPLNKYLRDQGFFVFNNTILTTPYTSLPELIESLIFYLVCPYPVNIAIEFGIMGHLGTKLNNEDIINENYDWRHLQGEDYGHYVICDHYRVPKTFKEYALNASHLINYVDPLVRESVLLLTRLEPGEFLRENLPQPEVTAVIQRWQRTTATQPEMKALANVIFYRQSKGQTDLVTILATIKEDMRMLKLTSFIDYYHQLVSGHLASDPGYRLIKQTLQQFTQHRQKGRDQQAASLLQSMITDYPWYATPYRHLVDLMLETGNYPSAVKYFMELQLIEPDIHYYLKFFSRFAQGIGFSKAHLRNRTLFHLPRYHTISPIYYFIAAVRQLAGGEQIKELVFITERPQDIENLYQIMDRLTVKHIKKAVAGVTKDLVRAMQSGMTLYFLVSR